MKEYLQSYVKTAKAVITQELEKSTSSIEEMEFVCMYYLDYIKRESPDVTATIVSAQNENLTVEIDKQTVDVSTIDLFIALYFFGEEIAKELFEADHIREFQNRLQMLRA